MYKDVMTVKIPNWCMIGKTIEWYNPDLVVFANDNPWFMEKIIAYGLDGFFHQWEDHPMYFSKFDEYGKTIREVVFTKKGE